MTSLTLPRAVTASALLALLAPAAAAQATFSNSVLTLVGTPANDDITAEVGPLPGQVRVSGIQGGGTFFGVRGITAALGDGLDKLQVIGSATFLPRLDLDFGLGQADAKVDFVFQSSPFPVQSAGVRIRTADQQDVVNVTLKTAPGIANVVFDLALGGGTNDAILVIEPENSAAVVRARADVRGGAGIDKVLLDVGGDVLQAEAALFGDLGGGNDEANVVLESRSGGDASATFGIDLGTGDDQAHLTTSNAATAVLGSLSTGDGQDVIELVSGRGFTGGVAVDSGAGNDSVKMITSLANASASQISAGDGDDVVEVLAGGPPVTPTTSDGGPGFDVFTGIGAVVNFEVVNR